MNQIMIRGLDDELSASVRRLAKRDGLSMKQAALKLLRKDAGLADGTRGAETAGSSLDDLFGTWSREEAEAEAFNAALEAFETVDESAWK